MRLYYGPIMIHSRKFYDALDDTDELNCPLSARTTDHADDHRTIDLVETCRNPPSCDLRQDAHDVVLIRSDMIWS